RHENMQTKRSKAQAIVSGEHFHFTLAQICTLGRCTAKKAEPACAGQFAPGRRIQILWSVQFIDWRLNSMANIVPGNTSESPKGGVHSADGVDAPVAGSGACDR